MSDHVPPPRNARVEESSPFDELLSGQSAPAPASTTFTTAFRGYDRDEVDEAMQRLTARLRADGDEIALLEERYRRLTEAATARSREFAAANDRAAKAARQAEAEAADERRREAVERLEAELVAVNARAANAEHRVEALTAELVEGGGQSADRPQFEEILRVAEDQASLVIRNASVQADRLLEAAREEVLNRRREVQAESESILIQAQHDAQQARLRIETELTAHQARLEREAAHAAERVSQAEQEAAAIRTEAEKGAAALRSMVARETTLARAEAEEAVRELRVCALEFEESLTRRQDDAQQEFLLLHNQAVAHAERITQDANEQVGASLEHAQRLAAKADDFDRLMRAQAQQIEADANIRARDQLDRARAKAQKIIETVTVHSQAVLRDAEDRTRQLRWQQHQLTSFMSEVNELIRPEMRLDTSPEEAAEDVVVHRADVRAGADVDEDGQTEPAELLDESPLPEPVEDDGATAEHDEPTQQVDHAEHVEHTARVEFSDQDGGADEPAHHDDHDERAEQHEYVEAASAHHEH
ncbi:DivIVA domain-containing protein [Microbacterium pumilum]|uniref:Cell division initiation protein n=1 Tax=Microbacterium pumilum TaxID=344165 RepID=A0ABP5DKN8_9MICO